MKTNALLGVLLCALLFNVTLQAQTCDPSVTLTSALPAPADLLICSDGSDAYSYAFPAPSFGSTLPNGALLIEITPGNMATPTLVAFDGATSIVADGSGFAAGATTAAGAFPGVPLSPGDQVCAVGFTADFAALNTVLNLAANPGVCAGVLNLDAETCAALAALVAGGGVQSLGQLLGAAQALGNAPVTSIDAAYSAVAAVEATAAGLNLGFCYDITGAPGPPITIPAPTPTDPNATAIVYDVTPDFCWTVEDCIPTVGEWGLISLSILFLSVGMIYIREKELVIERA